MGCLGPMRLGALGSGPLSKTALILGLRPIQLL